MNIDGMMLIFDQKFFLESTIENITKLNTNYVDKTRWVGGTGNVNCIQIFPHFSKEIPQQMPTGGGWVGGQ